MKVAILGKTRSASSVNMHTQDRPPHSHLRLLAGWWVLLIYLGAFSPLGVGGAGLLGLFDSDHEVVLQAGMDKMRVVLHHRGDCPPHQHGPLARTLTLFAQPASATDPDHVLQFGATLSLLKKSEPVAPFTPGGEETITTGAKTARLFALATYHLTPSVHPPPDIPVRLLCLRSTVLLV